MDTFKQFLEETEKASGVLTEIQVQTLLEAVGEQPYKTLYGYAYRIAGLVAVYVRSKTALDGLDEGDWQDAVQECMVQFPTVLDRYSKSDAPFLKYVARSFQNILKDYVWTLSKGGTGTAASAAEQTSSYEDAAVSNDMDEEDSSYSLESTSHSTRDPMQEMISEETVRELVIRAAFKRTKRGPRPEGKPISKADAQSLRMHSQRARLCLRRGAVAV